MDNYRPMFLLTKPFGFNIRSFRQSGTKISSSGLSRSGTVLFLINESILSYYAFLNRFVAAGSNYVRTGSELLDVGGLLMLQIAYVILILALLVRATSKHQRLMGQILDGFGRVDRRIRAELGVGIDYDREWRLAVRCFGLFLATALIAAGFGVYCLYLFDNLPDGVLFYGGQIYACLSGCVLTFNIFIMIFLLYRRVYLVRSCLRNIIHSKPKTVQSSLILFKAKEQLRPAETFHLKISTVALIYDDLYNLSRKQSNFIWTEVAAYMGMVVTYGIMTQFAAYRAISTGHFKSIVASSMYLVLWGQYCLAALAILTMGHLLEMVSQRTVHFLGVSIASDNVQRGLEEIKVRALMLQISTNPPKITTWFFDVNLRVFFNMLGTIASFVFIMVQFDV